MNYPLSKVGRRVVVECVFSSRRTRRALGNLSTIRSNRGVKGIVGVSSIPAGYVYSTTGTL